MQRNNFMDENPVIEKLKELVKQDGSQQKVSDRLDISLSYLSLILAGKREISDNLARKLGYLRAPTKWVPIRPDTGLAVSADGKIHGDQVGEALARLDARMPQAQK
jgi:transcriptional regulator with XRE-family HTH domain